MGSLPESYSDPLDLLEVLVLSPILTTGRKVISISGLTGRCTTSFNESWLLMRAKSFWISEENGS